MKEVSSLPAAAALLLVAHGSARYPDAAAALLRHARTLRTSGAFSQVEIGLLNGAPSVSEALACIRGETVLVVPFFMEAGYFTNIAIPGSLRGDPRARCCLPVGLHAGMADIMEAQGLAGCAAATSRPHETVLLAVGHGSARSPGRALALYDHAAAVASRKTFARVATACLEEAPLLGDALQELRAHPVVVVGFFAGEGMHMRDDVPNAIAAERAARGPDGAPVWLQGSVADDPSICAIIAAQAASRGSVSACSPMLEATQRRIATDGGTG